MDGIRFGEIGTGIGGFRRGLEEVGGFESVWSCDFDKYANQIYLNHWPGSTHDPADVKGIDTGNIPDFDLLCSGFPCQPFSDAGKREGFEDTRGTLFFEILRIAEAKKPQMLFLENVESLRWHDEGRSLAKILLRIRSLGYNVGYQVFNSRFHGVAQDRPRCFIIGVLREGGPKQILPILQDDRIPDEVSMAETMVPTAKSLTAGGRSGGLHSYMTLIMDPFNQRVRKDDVAGALKTRNSPLSTGTVVALTTTNPHKLGGERVYRPTEIARALTEPWGNQHTLIVDWLTGKLRRLTPRECERIQGFPDDWTKGLSDYQRYRLLGNAVTVNVIEVISQHIKEAFNEEAPN